ncbi:MAG: type II toxin-antitoxin system VapC family toxin [Acidimicrobiales bacterium]|nr:type II toxin-antitoxin system VapC family toxin [Acidimicrobiales bacterium]
MVVDTSAVVALLMAEPQGPRIEQRLLEETGVMSAATRVELGMVIEARSGPAGTLLLDELLDRVDIDVVAVDAALADEALRGWRRFGKGRHPASLNYGDTFSYALARQLDLPLLFVGDDFTHTDVRPA